MGRPPPPPQSRLEGHPRAGASFPEPRLLRETPGKQLSRWSSQAALRWGLSRPLHSRNLPDVPVSPSPVPYPASPCSLSLSGCVSSSQLTR